MENGVFKNVSTILIANPAPVTRAPSARTFASLCSLVASAEKQSPHKAARIPLNRFAVIEIPIPVPQIVIPIWVFCLFFRFAQLEEYFQSVSLFMLYYNGRKSNTRRFDWPGTVLAVLRTVSLMNLRIPEKMRK